MPLCRHTVSVSTDASSSNTSAISAHGQHGGADTGRITRVPTSDISQTSSNTRVQNLEVNYCMRRCRRQQLEINTRCPSISTCTQYCNITLQSTHTKKVYAKANVNIIIMFQKLNTQTQQSGFTYGDWPSTFLGMPPVRREFSWTALWSKYRRTEKKTQCWPRKETIQISHLE